MQPTAYISRRVVLPDGVGPACVAVLEGRIAGVFAGDAAPVGYRVEDLGECALLPGLVDTHVHANEPGRTEWEGFRTVTQAAAAGGVTTIVDMPLNCLPETTSVRALEAKRTAATGQCHVDWRPWGGAVNGNQSELAGLARAGVPGFKCFLIYPGCDGFGLIDGDDLRLAMPEIAKTGLPLLVHAELAGPIVAATEGLNAQDWRRYRTYLASRPDAAEVEAIRLMIDLCREFRARVHIVHLATAEALPLLRAARAEGLPITVETCPHYLAFAAEEVADGATEYKCAPPLRSAANRELLWAALAGGEIDLVASDHSPCPPRMKNPDGLGSFLTAWGGIASVSLGLPVMWTEMRARGLGLELLVRAMAEQPALLAGMGERKGALRVGLDADLVVFDADAEWVVGGDDLHFRHAVSPYLGRRLTGRVERTLLRGVEVYRRGQRFGQAYGREVRP